MGRMMLWLKGISIVIVIVAFIAILVSMHGAARWESATQELLARIEVSRVPHEVTRFDARELERLPPPVHRYFRSAFTDGQAMISAVSVDHTGTFNMGEGREQWRPFTSQQRVISRRPGFVWNASVSMLPGVPVRVHDAYVGGEGILHPSILGLFTLVDMRGTGEVARGELMRFFAEAAWYPTAILPSQGVRWSPTDDHSANAMLIDGAVTLTMLFRFNQDGLIESIRAEARGRTVGKRIVMMPWEGRWSNYQMQAGMRVPMTGEVAWLTPEGRRPYWRGTITSLRYEFAK